MEGYISITISRDLYAKLDSIRAYQARERGVDLSWNEFLNLAVSPISDAFGDGVAKKTKGGR